jgi:F-type H+-transporting ATPase subunit epsilon
MTTFNFQILTLAGSVYSDEVERVTIPTKAGEITVLPRHTALVSLLAPGELRIKKGHHTVVMAVSEGFLEVRPSRNGKYVGEVIILADTAERAEHIDVEKAQVARERAEKALKEKDSLTEMEYARFLANLEKEMARIKVATRYKG